MSYFKPLFLIACFLAPMSCFCVDIENGEEINEVCAGCHGEYGQGGKDGEYPRLAGMPAAFRSKQLHLFRERIRPNLAMVEYVDDRQMPDEDIEDIAHYLERIELKTKLPPADETSPDFNAYERLIQSKHLMQIPRAPGDVVRGRESYKKECAVCHGQEGWGKMDKAIPLLAGQYTNYLWRQVRKYREGIRIHDAENPNEELLSDFTQSLHKFRVRYRKNYAFRRLRRALLAGSWMSFWVQSSLNLLHGVDPDKYGMNTIFRRFLMQLSGLVITS